MKIDGPGGKIPELPENQGPDKVQGPKGADFESKMGEAQGGEKAEGVSKTDGPQTSELRKLLQDVDANDPNRLGVATDRMVEWVLKDTFGDQVLRGPKAEDLRSAIKEQLLADPNQSSRIQKILDRL